MVEGVRIPFVGEEARVQILHDFQRDASGKSIEAIGGESLAGSGFETEEPEPGFAGAEEVED
jgi:hypothetical protein